MAAKPITTQKRTITSINSGRPNQRIASTQEGRRMDAEPNSDDVVVVLGKITTDDGTGKGGKGDDGSPRRPRRYIINV